MFKTLYIIVLVLIHVTNISGDPTNGDVANWECNSDEWHVILKDYVAGSIMVTYEDNSTEMVPLAKTVGVVSHYTWEVNNKDIVDITAEVSENWDSKFVISHGPCEGTAVIISDLTVDVQRFFLKLAIWSLLYITAISLLNLLLTKKDNE